MSETPMPGQNEAIIPLPAAGWPLIIAGAVKSVYDLLLLAWFRRLEPPEEQRL